MGTSSVAIYEVWAEFTYPDPVITSFTASKTLITAGESVSLLPIFNGGNGSVNGVAVTTGTPLIVMPMIPTTYVLSVQDVTGQSTVVAAEVTVNAVPAPHISSFTTPTLTPLYGATPTITPIFSDGEASISGVPGPIVSGQAYTLTAITDLRTCTLTVTNAAGAVTSSTLTLTPQVPSMAAITAASVLTGHATTFVATITGAADTAKDWYVDDILGGNATVGTITAAGVYTAPTDAGTHVIKAVSVAYPSAFRTTTVTVIPPATGSITTTNSNPLYGASVTLKPTFANGSAVIGTYQGGSDVAVGLTSGQAVSSGAVTAQTIYWLRVTGPLGDIVDASVLVTPKVVAMTPISPDSPTVSTSRSVTFSTTVSNAANSGVTWTCTAGVIDASGNWTAPTASGQVTITGTSKGDPSKSVSTTVTVIPVITVNSLTVLPSTISYGATSNVYVAFVGAASMQLSGGSLSALVSSGQTVPTPPLTQTTTYTLAGTNAAGTLTTQSVTVTVLPVVVSDITAPASYVASGRAMTFDANVTDAVNTNIVWSASGPGGAGAGAGTWNGSIWTAPTTLGSYVITATAAADNTTSKTFACNVVSMSLLPDSLNVLYGEDVLLTPTFLGTAVVDHGIGEVTSGVSFSTGPITSTTVFKMLVTPGDTIGFSATITPATVVVAPITPSSQHITVGHMKSFTTTVTGAVNNAIVWSVDGVVGGNATVGTISANGTYTAPSAVGFHEIAATAVADGVTKQVTTVHIVPVPVIASLSVSNDRPLYGDTVLVSAYYSGAYATIGTTMGGTDIATTVYSSMEQGLDHSVAVPSTPIKGNTKIWLRVFDEAGDFVDTYTTVVPQTVTLTPIQPADAKVSVGYTATFSSFSNGAVDTTVTWGCTDGSFNGATWLAPVSEGVYTIYASAIDNQAVVSAQVHVVPLVTEKLTAVTNPCLFGGSTMLVPMFNGSSATIDHGVGSVTNLVPVDSGPITEPTTFTLTVQNPAGQTASTSLLVEPLPVSVSPITPTAPTRMSRTFTRFSASVSGALDPSIIWSCSAGTIDATGKWIAPEIPAPVEIFATSLADPTKFSNTTVTVVSASIISAQVNALHPNRLELYINDFNGPLVSSHLGAFDPRRDISIYSGGVVATTRSFTFDAPNNRYLIYLTEPLDYNGIVQVIHHLPSVPFHGIGATELDPQRVPGFAIVATRVDQVESNTDVVLKSFYHVPEAVAPAGEPVLLFWEVENADHVVITSADGFTSGAKPSEGQLEVPAFGKTTLLTLTAYNAAGNAVGVGTDAIKM